MAFGELTVGQKALSANIAKVQTNKKEDTTTTSPINFTQRGSRAGADAYKNFDWSQFA